MEIVLEYNTGQTFKIRVTEDAYKNTIACILDDISTTVKGEASCESNWKVCARAASIEHHVRLKRNIA